MVIVKCEYRFTTQKVQSTIISKLQHNNVITAKADKGNSIVFLNHG